MACDRDCRCNACICDMFDFRKNQGPVPPGHGGLVATLGRVNNLPDGLHAARRLAIARGRGRVPDRPWPAASAARGALFWPAFPDRTTFWPRGDELYSGRLPLDDPQWHPPITILNGPGSSVTVTPGDPGTQTSGFLDTINPCDDWRDGVVLADPPNVDIAADSPVTPCVTRDPGATKSPDTDRVRLATSTDGLNWTRLHLSVATRAAVPSMVVDQGTVYLFMVASNTDPAGGRDDVSGGIMVGTSTDLVEWSFYHLLIEYRPGWTQGDDKSENPDHEWKFSQPVDPSVVWVDDDKGPYWRMYYTLISGEGDAALFRTFSAIADSPAGPWIAEDGFRYAGPFPSTLEDIKDPTVLWMGDRWILFAGGVEVGLNHYAESFDGLEFTAIDGGYLRLEWEGDPAMMANGLDMDGVYRFYAFAVDIDAPEAAGRSQPPANVVSFVWDAGMAEWLPEDGLRLTVDASDPAETYYAMDPAVVRFGDCWLMAYVTEARKLREPPK